MTQPPTGKDPLRGHKKALQRQPERRQAAVSIALGTLGARYPLNPDLTPMGALLPTLLFVGHCLNCDRDTLFALVKSNNVNNHFCSLCGQYTPVK